MSGPFTRIGQDDLTVNITSRTVCFDPWALPPLAPRRMPVSEREERAARCTMTNYGVARPIRRASSRSVARVEPSRPVSQPRRRVGFQGCLRL